MQIRLLVACLDPADGGRIARAVSEDLGDPRITGEASGMASLHETVAVSRPDVLLLQRCLAGELTLQTLAHVARISPDTKSLLLCEPCQAPMLVELVRLGTLGSVQMDSDGRLLAKAVRGVARGEAWYGRAALLEALRSQLGVAPIELAAEETKLTHREEEVLQLIGLGLTNKEIGRRLEISDHTVKTHLHRVYSKLHQSGRYKAFLSQAPVQGGRPALPQ